MKRAFGGIVALSLSLGILEDRTLLASLTIAQENQLPGTPESVWDNISGIGDPQIQGFATNMSVNVGQTKYSKSMIRPTPPTKSISIASATTRETVPASSRRSHRPRPRCRSSRTHFTTPRPGCTTRATGRCPRPGRSHRTPPRAFTSPTWSAMTRGGCSQIIFVVRNDASHSDILFTTFDATWQAYNDWGGTSQNAAQNNGIWLGNSLYTGTGPGYQGTPTR